VGQMLQAQQTLVHGSPVAKAQMLAGIIHGYGVPIEALAAALDGKGSAPAGQAAPPTYRDPRLDQLFASLQERRTAMESQAAEEAQTAWQEFTAKHEFAEDLRETIADLLEVGNRGARKRTLEEAYDLALRASPEHAKVISQREAAKAATASAAAMQAKKAAASSLKGVPGGDAGGASAKGGTLRQDLEMVWNQLQSK